MTTPAKILTVIVPSYNMENYLAYCLESLLVKDHFNLLEVLVINDGSKDRTSEIAHSYETRYPSVFRVIDKENGNYGSCINRGLKEATGKYVKILDADDSFDTANFEKFIEFLCNHDTDLVISDFAVVNESRVRTKEVRYNFGNDSYKMSEICATGRFIDMEMHAVTYRTKLLRNIGYSQSEGISYTDQQWIFTPMAYVKTIACFNVIVYNYLIGRAGQTVASDIQLRSLDHIGQCMIENVHQFELRKEAFAGNVEVRTYLEQRLISNIKGLYVACLTNYSDSTRKLLSVFDEQLRSASTYIHTLVADRNNSAFLGCQYIELWRKHKDAPLWIINLLSKTYLRAVRIKKSV